jgi:hypothetical protein
LADVLPAAALEQALRDEQVTFRDRLFTPLVTLWVFLSQVLDPDHSCRAAVARFGAWRAAGGLSPCSADTRAYGKARRRLPEGVLARLTRAAGRPAQDQAPPAWRCNGRTVKVVDGTTLSLPDTPANQRQFPHNPTPKPGLGFPSARLVVRFALAVGTALDAALGRSQGKHTGATALWHTLHDNLPPGDLLLRDRSYGSFGESALAPQRGADVVTRWHQRRKADCRTGGHLGREDHVLAWAKPSRPAWMDEATYACLPATLAVREVRVRVWQAGFRTRLLVAVTTLLEPEATPRSDVAVRYRMRWLAELDLRALKQTLPMDVRRCQSPELVRKEVWAQLLAYNLVRRVMARAAQQARLLPVPRSVTAAVQAVNALAGVPWPAGAKDLEAVGRRLRAVLVSPRVGERPNRDEPRARKRRPKEYPLLSVPRDKARARCRSGRYS